MLLKLQTGKINSLTEINRLIQMRHSFLIQVSSCLQNFRTSFIFWNSLPSLFHAINLLVDLLSMLDPASTSTP